MSNLVARRIRGLTRPAFGDDFFKPFFFGDPVSPAFRVDVRDEGEFYRMEAELPGLNREDIHVDVDEGMLTVSAEWDCGKDGGDYLLCERCAGHVQRSFALENVKEDEITADYANGILSLKLPKRTGEGRTARRIELN